MNLDDGCGFTAGWIGFCSATGDMYDLVVKYDAAGPGNPLQKYASRLKQLADSGSASTSGLGSAFVSAWKKAAGDPTFRRLQLEIGHDTYLTPARKIASRQGVTTLLGLENFFDTALMMGPDPTDCDGLPKLVEETDRAMGGSIAQGTDEKAWFAKFNQIRTRHLKHPCTPGRQQDWPNAVDRTQALEELADSGNGNLTPPVHIGADFNATIATPTD